MKFAIFILIVLVTVQGAFVHADNFKKIASYRINNDDVKHVFLTRYIRNNWLNGLMVCEENGSELFRIESLEEYSKIQKALKIHSTEFKDSIFVDGKMKYVKGTTLFNGSITETDETAWEFLTNGKEVDEGVINLLDEYRRQGCLALTQKDVFGIKLAFTDCSNNLDFLCQKVVKASRADTDDDVDANKPIVVDVKSQIFKELGRFQRKNSKYETEFFLSNFPVSSMMASHFCKHFNMKLVGIHNEEDLTLLGKLLLREGTNERYSIGHVDEKVLEKFDFVDYRRRCFGLIFDRFKPEIKNLPCDEQEREFICEPSEGKVIALHRKTQNVRTTGMKFLATYELSDARRSLYLNDVVSASSWFEAFLYCKSLEMELYNPDDSKVNKFAIEALQKATTDAWRGKQGTVAIGGSRFGSESFFYSMMTGKEIELNGSSENNGKCLGIIKANSYEDEMKVESIECKPSSNLDFMCETAEKV